MREKTCQNTIHPVSLQPQQPRWHTKKQTKGASYHDNRGQSHIASLGGVDAHLTHIPDVPRLIQSPGDGVSLNQFGDIFCHEVQLENFEKILAAESQVKMDAGRWIAMNLNIAQKYIYFNDSIQKMCTKFRTLVSEMLLFFRHEPRFLTTGEIRKVDRLVNRELWFSAPLQETPIQTPPPADSHV